MEAPTDHDLELWEPPATPRAGFVELSARSSFSFLRGGSSPQALIEAAVAQGYDCLALSDCDGLYGMVRALEAARKHPGFKLIVGAELRLARSPLHAAGGTVSVSFLVQDAHGYQNLCRLITLAHADCEKGEALLTLAALEGHTEGLFVLLHAPYTYAVELFVAFGERLSLALAFHKDGGDRRRAAQAQAVSETLDLPIVATNHVLFATPADKPLYDVLQCIREKTTLQEAGRRLLPNTEAHLKSPAEMQRLFAAHPRWLARSRSIADRCHFDLGSLKVQFPSEVDPGELADDKLRRLTLEGMARRYPEGAPRAVREQVEKELGIIAAMELPAYFLSVHDIVQIARERNILCQGRGSAANSAVCYCLGITAVDPAQSNSLFERFLSQERGEPPDIDVDFEHERREEVIQAIYEKYGRHRAAMVCEVIRYRSRSALREVAKVFGYDAAMADRMAKCFSYWDTLDPAVLARLLGHDIDLDEPRLALVFSIAQRLQGYPRHLSIHVGGFVVSAHDLARVAPIEPASMPGRTIIPWDKDDLDTLKFFKLDVLGLGMLSAVRRALRLVDPAVARGRSYMDALAAIPREDPCVYEALGRADTVGVFQIESRAQMAMLPRLRPEKFYDLVVEVAIVRPGPIQGGAVHPYLRRKMKLEAPVAPHPILEPILERTLGVPLFQEQVMQIAITGAGYTGGEADQLRRDMAAWQRKGNMETHRVKLERGFAAKGLDKAFADRLFAQIEGFAEYGFPESHAASFALLVYASAWLKVHHPAAFVAALINSQPMGFYSSSTLIEDAKRHDVNVLPIDVSHSDWDCTLETEPAPGSAAAHTSTGQGRAPSNTVGGPLRLGLRLVKGLSRATAQRIVQARLQGSFDSLEHLVARAGLSQSELALLAEAGALESCVEGRRQAMWRAAAPREKSGLFAGHMLDPSVPVLPALGAAEQLSLDYGRTGVSVEQHPLAILRPQLGKRVVRSDLLQGRRSGSVVEVAGMVICRQRPATASGVVFLTLEDEAGFVNLVVYARVYEALRHVLGTQSLLHVRGKLEISKRPADTAGNLTPHDPTSAPLPQGTVHVLVESARGLHLLGSSSRRLELDSMSRDFH